MESLASALGLLSKQQVVLKNARVRWKLKTEEATALGQEQGYPRTTARTKGRESAAACKSRMDWEISTLFRAQACIVRRCGYPKCHAILNTRA